MEDEASKILDDALGKKSENTDENLYTKIRAIVEPVGGIELELPTRSRVRPIPFLGWDDDVDNS